VGCGIATPCGFDRDRASAPGSRDGKLKTSCSGRGVRRVSSFSIERRTGSSLRGLPRPIGNRTDQVRLRQSTEYIATFIQHSISYCSEDGAISLPPAPNRLADGSGRLRQRRKSHPLSERVRFSAPRVRGCAANLLKSRGLIVAPTWHDACLYLIAPKGRRKDDTISASANSRSEVSAPPGRDRIRVF
jgi:hypothetical protein